MDQLQIVKRTSSGLSVQGSFDLSRNPNLLHNWDFTNPVNQRGGGSTSSPYISTSGEIPTIDRWRAGTNMKVEVVSGGIKLTGQSNTYRTFRQTIENPERLAGKTVTVGLNILACTGKFTSYFVYPNSPGSTTTTNGIVIEAGTTGIKKYTVTLPSAADMGDTLKLHIGNSSVSDVSMTLASVKLELGNVCTLKDTDLANRAEQEMICQSFLLRIGAAQRFRLEGYTTNVVHARIPTPQRMRAIPTVETISDWSLRNLSYVSSGVTISNIEVLQRDPDLLLRATSNAHGLTEGMLCADNATFISAEL
ncbi:MAG: hypothetical protein K6E42_02350 [Synergistes sp.]|nr:hypothetical protein [Synergistes sp.]